MKATLPQNINSVGFRIVNKAEQSFNFAIFTGLLQSQRTSPITRNVPLYESYYEPLFFKDDIKPKTKTDVYVSESSILFEDSASIVKQYGILSDFIVTTPFVQPFYILSFSNGAHVTISRLAGNFDILRQIQKRSGIEIVETFIKSINPANVQESLKIYDLSAVKQIGYTAITVEDYFDPSQKYDNMFIINKNIKLTPYNVMTFKILAGNTIEISFKIKDLK